MSATATHGLLNSSTYGSNNYCNFKQVMGIYVIFRHLHCKHAGYFKLKTVQVQQTQE